MFTSKSRGIMYRRMAWAAYPKAVAQRVPAASGSQLPMMALRSAPQTDAVYADFATAENLHPPLVCDSLPLRVRHPLLAAHSRDGLARTGDAVTTRNHFRLSENNFQVRGNCRSTRVPTAFANSRISHCAFSSMRRVRNASQFLRSVLAIMRL